MSDTIGQAELELGQITNTMQAEAFHRRWLGATGTLRLLAARNPALSHYYRRLHQQWRRSAAASPRTG